jgi:hypothetical protein
VTFGVSELFISISAAVARGSLGSSAILGIQKNTHLSTNEYNNLGSAFYIGYLVFQYPQQLALQRFPVARWLSFNIFLWCVRRFFFPPRVGLAAGRIGGPVFPGAVSLFLLSLFRGESTRIQNANCVY